MMRDEEKWRRRAAEYIRKRKRKRQREMQRKNRIEEGGRGEKELPGRWMNSRGGEG